MLHSSIVITVTPCCNGAKLMFLQGNTGKDDDVVQTYMVQASEGDVGSMLALGEMNYYGTRGIPRVSY